MEGGLCCQDKVPDLVGTVVDAEGGFGGGEGFCGSSMIAPAAVCKPARCFDSVSARAGDVGAAARGCGSGDGERTGAARPGFDKGLDVLGDLGLPTGELFSGDKDLSRSKVIDQS